MERKGGFKPGNTFGNRFSTNNQPANKGKKPSIYKQIKAIAGKNVTNDLSKEDFYLIINFLINLTPAELRTITGLDKESPGERKSIYQSEAPLWLVNIATALLSDARYGRLTTLNVLFDRMFGRSSFTIENNQTNILIQNNYYDLSRLTVEELDTIVKILDKTTNKNPLHLPDY